MQPTDNNLLEQALRLAAEEPAHRPRFIELLLDAEVVDFCAVEADDNSNLSQYFINQTTPFYQRRWGSKLKSWLAKGRA